MRATASRRVASGRERDGIEDHPALGALDPVDFRRLAVDRHVLVDDADAARPRHRDRHLRLSVTVSIAAETSGTFSGMPRVNRDAVVDVLRVGDRMTWDEKDVIEGERRVDSDAIR